MVRSISCTQYDGMRGCGSGKGVYFRKNPVPIYEIVAY